MRASRPLLAIVARLGLAIGGLALGLLVAEVVLSATTRLREPGLTRSSLRRQRAELLRRVTGRRGPQDRFDSRVVLHPFFGYTFNPADPAVNSFGFETPYDFDIGPDGEYVVRGLDRDSTAVVGVFGGSFARLVGELGPELERRLEPWPDGRRPVVINFAVGGYALPQTAFTYLTFADMIDVAVFIDGLNELWNAVENVHAGVPPEYAKASHYLFKTSRLELSPDHVALASRILSAHRRLSFLERLLDSRPLDRSYAAHAVFMVLARHWTGQILDSNSAIEEGMHTGGPTFDLDNRGILRHAARRWLDWHRVIEEVARQHGTVALHVLQPNPFVPESKQLTPTERSRIRHSYPVEDLVVAGYPMLRRALATMAAEGAVVDDATGVFRDLERSVWIDAAHPDGAGCRLMAEQVAVLVREHRGHRSGAGSPPLAAVRTP